MNANQIRPCDLCNKGLMHTGVPLFWRVRIERMGIDLAVARQQHGLEVMLGNVAIARVMGAHEGLAKPLQDEPTELIVCEACALERELPVAALSEIKR